MCNACGNLCCGSDEFEGCGCESCGEEACLRICKDCGENECDGFCQDTSDYDLGVCDGDDDFDVDVCQNCGGYFIWSPELTAVWREKYNPASNACQPQRCRACLVDECWVEDRDAAAEAAGRLLDGVEHNGMPSVSEAHHA